MTISTTAETCGQPRLPGQDKQKRHSAHQQMPNRVAQHFGVR